MFIQSSVVWEYRGCVQNIWPAIKIYTHFCYLAYTDNSPISYLLPQTLFLIACFISAPGYSKYLKKSKSKSFHSFPLLLTSDSSHIRKMASLIPFPQVIQVTNLRQSWLYSPSLFHLWIQAFTISNLYMSFMLIIAVIINCCQASTSYLFYENLQRNTTK